MKKLIMVAAIVATIGGFAIASGQHGNQNNNMMNSQQSYNQNMMGNGQGYGQGYRHKGKFNKQFPCNGQRQSMMMGTPGMNGTQGNFKSLTEKEVKVKIEQVINTDFKGLKIASIEKFKMPRGIVYTVNVKDSRGNESVFRVNPWGNVVGPFRNIR